MRQYTLRPCWKCEDPFTVLAPIAAIVVPLVCLPGKRRATPPLTLALAQQISIYVFSSLPRTPYIPPKMLFLELLPLISFSCILECP